jgi:CRISPR/Cas system CMR subunit Cmr4 (Cas7 group RAMP superfamily)
MTTYWLEFALKSDATFGRGDGIAGMIDSEVQHDEYGLPYLGGRALKGLLGEECANIIFWLKAQGKAQRWQETAQRLFGKPGSKMMINPSCIYVMRIYLMSYAKLLSGV